MPIEITIAMKAIWIETRIALPMRGSTGSPFQSDSPKSPRTTPLAQSRYCSAKPRSRPSSARMAASCSSLA